VNKKDYKDSEINEVLEVIRVKMLFGHCCKGDVSDVLETKE
jgi:hypothetical protein